MKLAKYLLIFTITGLLIFPICWMIIGSLQSLHGILRMPPRIIPASVSLANYKNLLLEPPGTCPPVVPGSIDLRTPMWFGKWSMNTIALIALKFSLVVVTSMMVGYAFSVYKFRYKESLFIVFICRMILPPTLLIPTFIAVKTLGMYNSWWGVLLPAAYSPLCMYLFKNQIDTIPRELIDSARIDGAGELRILTDVIFPLCKPTIGVIGVLVAIGVLQDYVWTSLILPSSEKQTLIVGIMQILHKAESIQLSVNPLGITLAGGVVMFVPLFLVFAFFQRYFVEGIQIGAVKG